jgi:NitT/TauT family transport system substrate-binding protein
MNTRDTRRSAWARSIAALTGIMMLLAAGCAGPAAPAARDAPAGQTAPGATAAPSTRASSASAGASTPTDGARTAPPAPLSTPLKVRLGSNDSVSNAPIYIAFERGYFTELSLDIEDIRFDAATRMMAPLAAGQLDVVPAAITGGIFNAFARDIDVRMVADRGLMAPGYGIFAAVARQDLWDSGAIRTLADLRGRRVAVTEQIGGVSSLLKSILRRQGLEPGDYAMVIVGGTPAQAEALRANQADAAMLTHPFEARLVAEGYRLHGYASDYFADYAFTTLNVRREWAEDYDDAVVALLRATARAGRWLFDPANAAPAQEILAQATGLTTAEVADTYRLYVQQGGVLAREAEIADAGMAAVLDVMREESLVAAAPAPDWYIDRSYWIRAQSDLARQP